AVAVEASINIANLHLTAIWRGLRCPLQSGGCRRLCNRRSIMDSQLAPGCSFGRVLKRYNVEGFTLSETSYPPHFNVPPHSHEQAFFYIVLEGKYTDVFGQTILASPDIGLVYHPAGETHSHYSHNTSVRCFNLDVGAYWRKRSQEIALCLERPLELRGGTA